MLGVDLKETYPSGRFPQMPFEESMGKYGNDKPDLRFGMPHTDVTDVVIEHGGGGIPFWKDIADKFTSGKYRRDLPAEIVKAMRFPAEHALSRAELDKLEEFVKGMGAEGLARAKVDAEGNWTQSPLAKTITPELRKAINAADRRGRRRPAPLPVRQGEHRPDRDGEPARSPREEDWGSFPRRGTAASSTSSGS